jgi:NitT/TauT family transport system substrate-binding protein
MKTRSIISVGVIGIILLAVLGISLNFNETTHENKIRIAYFPNIGHAVPIVGMEKGFFEKIRSPCPLSELHVQC